MPLTEKQKTKYLELKEQGLTIAEIAKKIKVSMFELDEYDAELESDKLKEDFIKLRSEGRSLPEILQALNLNMFDFIELSDDWVLDLQNEKALVMDEIQKKYNITKSKRMESFGSQLLAVKEELSKRNLADIPTEKLFNLYLRLGQFLKDEETEIQLKRDDGDQFRGPKEWQL